MVKKTVKFQPHPPPDPGRNYRWLGWALGLLLVAAAAKEYLRYNALGEAELTPQRVAKLLRELDELDDAEQYVLLAAKPGHYPCFSCTGKSSIFLHQGQVWKYGVTRKGERGRYGNWHVDQGLLYFIEYTGPLQEKLKIYNYALLPENLARTPPLIRPPGNKQDN